MQCNQRLHRQAGRSGQMADHPAHTKTLPERKGDHPALGRKWEELSGAHGEEG